ncbi:tetratricopeptide repeat protein 28-like [Branchiostoma lanceolatum]|uniref:tetratricopeptide repeat protein 28-like n=1 Tax=Branchiostoma lanceolatum TaxID=7740 RepID=UPI0034552A7B
MAQLSRLAQLYLKISDNLTEDDVRNLRSLLSLDEVLGKGKVEKATPLEIFNMLVDNATIGKGNLGFLVQILRCLGKGKFADEAELLETEHKIEGKKTHDTTAMTPELGDSRGTSDQGDSATADSELEDREVKDIISAEIPSGAATIQDTQRTTDSETLDDAEVEQVTSELASLHIRELERLTDEPMKKLGLRPDELGSSADYRDAQTRLETLLAELDTPAVMADQEKQFHLYCQIGDLYRAKIYNLQPALQYYQSMLECSKSLFQLNEPQVAHIHYTKMLALARDSGMNYWEMQAYNRLGLVCGDMQDSTLALEWHQMSLNKSLECADKRDQIIAQLNVGASLGKVKQAKSHLDTGLQMAQQKGDQYWQMTAYMHMGDMQRDKFNSPRSSIQYYEQALALARQLGDRRQEGRVYSRLGHAHVEQREYEEALGWYEKHLKVSREREDKKEEVTAHTALGNEYRLLGQHDQATSHFDTALQMAEQTEDLHGQMDVYCKMGEMQREQLSSPRASVKHYEQYLALARQLLNRAEEALAYERLGQAHYDMGEYEKALKWYQKHLDMSQDNGDNKQQIRAHTNLGQTYRLLGKPDQATSHISTALQMAQQTGDQHGQMNVYFCMGEMQRNQLDSPRTSVQYYEQYLALAKQLGNKYKERVAHNKLGLAHFEMGEYDTALEWHQKDLKASEESGDKNEQINALRNVGNVYWSMGKVDQATSHFNTALQMAQQTGDQHGQMYVYCKLGDMQREQLHSPRTAIQYYEQQLALARQLGDRYEEGVAYNRLGLAYGKAGEYEEALELHRKYLNISQERGDKKEQITAHTAVGNAYSLLGKVDQATSHLETAIQMAQQIDQYKQIKVYFSMGEMQREQLHSPRTSIQYYEEHLALARQLEDMHEEGMACHKLGLAHDEMEEYQLALEWHQKALKTCQEHGTKQEQIAAQTCVGDTYRKLGNSEQATFHFNAALQMAQQTGDLHGQMRVYCKLGDLQREQLQSPRTSIQYYEQYLALARQLGNSGEEGNAYGKLGVAYYAIEEYRKALDCFHKDLNSIQEYRKMKDHITTHKNIADCYQKLRIIDQATHHYQSALSIAKEAGNKTEQMDTCRELGDIHWRQLQEPQVSKTYYTDMLKLAKELETKDMERQACNRLGLACNDTNDSEAALDWHSKYLEMSQDNENKIPAHKNIAVTYKALSKPDLARSHYQSALTIAMETGNKQQQMDINRQMGDLHMEQLHEPQISLNYYTEMLALARNLERKPEEGQAYNRLGAAHYHMREYETALEWLQKFLKMSKETGDRKEEINAYKNIAGTYQTLGKPDQAISHYQSAMAIAMETGNKQEQEDIAKDLASL